MNWMDRAENMGMPVQNRLAITIEKNYTFNSRRAGFPLRHGRYSDIKTADYEFVFNLNGEIKYIRGLRANWPHPFEQLKRTDGNDWVYYSVGAGVGEDKIVSWMGEYYLPCLPYPSNPVVDFRYYSNPDIMQGFAAWSQLYADLYSFRNSRISARYAEVVDLILSAGEQKLYERSQVLQEIIGERIQVLPPDTRYVDYEVIPVTVADGCLYQCKFCCVKSRRRFQPRTRDDISEQIQRLRRFYGRNIENYRALFLGNSDALAAGIEPISQAALESFDIFGFGKNRSKSPFLFFFASVDSLLDAQPSVFEKLESLPYYTYINVGFESVDAPTLASIGKPLTLSGIRRAFEKMLAINSAYKQIEITGNFLLGETLSLDHYQSLGELLGSADCNSAGKGGVYLSPLKSTQKKRLLLEKFNEIKAVSRLPVYIYLIQRL